MNKLTDFIVFDLENPNRRGNSICSLGIIVVKNGLIKEKIYSLINPEDRFDRNNIEVHGIEPYMVQNEKTLKEYWPKIKELFSKYIIVGHNIRYDLNVLAKSLERYDIEVPKVQFCCTLDLAKFYLPGVSYNLTDLVKQYDYNYNAHNALEDCLACFELFSHLQKEYDVSSFIRPYTYETILKQKIDEQLISNLNDLHGIIQGIVANDVITPEEIELLRTWINDNLIYKQYQLFNEIITRISDIIEDNKITDYELVELQSLTRFINESKIYNINTLTIQVLKGIIHGIIADSEIDKKELNCLEQWLEDNNFLSGVYPYDVIYKTVENVLEDGKLTKAEEKELKELFSSILNPTETKTSDINLKNSVFCLTGEFTHGSKSQISSLLTKAGAEESKSVCNRVDYLFVGGVGSDAWAFGNYGGKVAKALEMQEKGHRIRIVNEEDLFKNI